MPQKGLGARHCHSACRLQDGSSLVEHVLQARGRGRRPGAEGTSIAGGRQRRGECLIPPTDVISRPAWLHRLPCRASPHTLMAADVAALSTSTTPSNSSRHSRKVSAPTCLSATPSVVAWGEGTAPVSGPRGGSAPVHMQSGQAHLQKRRRGSVPHALPGPVIAPWHLSQWAPHR